MFYIKKFLLTVMTIIFVIALSKGHVSAAPTIQRFGGADRYETSIQVSKNNWQQSDNVVLVSGNNFPDALCASPLAKKYEAPILLSDGSDLNTNVKEEIKRLGAKNAIIVGGIGAIPENVETQLKSMGITIVRFQGKDRYETSLEIAKNIGTSNGIVLASGENFPDAVSIASIAASKKMPILLTPQSDLRDTTKQYIANNNVSICYVVGGTGAISDSAISNIKNYKRLYGKDRYETNSAIVNEFASDISYNKVYIASGEGFPDALSGSAAAAKTASPVILINNTAGNKTTLVKDNIKLINIVNVLGGTAVVSENTVQKVINGQIIITIDAGHGGYDSGAVGPKGTYEKNVTLGIALKLGKILQQNGIGVVYTRTSDDVSWPSNVQQDLQTRCDISDAAGANYFVAIHTNSAENLEARGTETYYYSSSVEGKTLAEQIQNELIASTDLVDRGIKTANFYVIKNTAAPSVLVEVGFISNPDEEALLQSDSFQTKLAEGIANGIVKTINKD